MKVEEFVYKSVMDFKVFLVNNVEVDYKDIKDREILWFGIDAEVVPNYETLETVYILNLGLAPSEC